MNLLVFALEVLKWLLLARALMSWFVPPDSGNPVVELIRRTTDPILRPIQGFIPQTQGIDFSPIVAFFAIFLLQTLLRSF